MYKPNFSLPGLPAVFLAATAALVLPARAGILVKPFGTTRAGEAVEQVTLENERGMKLTLVDRGAALTGVWVPDRQGRLGNVMLSLPTVAAGEASAKRHGSIVGRYAGRIGGGAYTLDGRDIKLPVNAQGAALHGDPNGFEKRVWRRRDVADAESIGCVFELVSPDGDQGHPGRLTLSVTYRLLRKQNEYRIEFGAVTDAPTVLNPANHGYFNLGGAGTHGIASHVFTFDAPRYVLTDAKRVPTGELARVDGTALDFRRGAGVMARMAAKPAELGDPAWYDHALVFAKPEGRFGHVATIVDTASGRRLDIATTEPSAVFNSGNLFDGKETGSEGVAYERYDGFAFEVAHLPDSPNHPNFPSTVLRPGQQFHSMTAYRFSVVK